MKLIAVSDEQYQFFQNLAEKMTNQSNRSTQYPLFVIQEKVKRYGDSSWCNEVERKSEFDADDLCDTCRKKYRDNEDLLDYCNDCDDNCFAWFNWEEEFNLNLGSFFFTEEACKEHIESNNYHYDEPRSYVISAWRNPEIQELFKNIFSIAGRDIPSCYR